MKLKSYLAGLALIAVTAAEVASALPACTFGHCTAFNPLTKQMCAAKYNKPLDQLTASHTINMYESGAECVCPCSCVVSETLIKLTEGDDILARTVRKGDELFLPQASRKDAPVYASAGAQVEKIELREVLFSNNKLLRVSPNHTFVGFNGKIIAAEKLRQHDRVLDVNSEPVSVIQTRAIKNYDGALFNFIVNETSKKPSDHIVVTNDIQSGDWLLQTTHDTLKTEMQLRTGEVETLESMLKNR